MGKANDGLDVPIEGLRLEIGIERWPIRGAFTIARGAKSEAVVVVTTLTDADHMGRGECVPYGRYGESVESVTAQLDGLRDHLDRPISRDTFARLLPAGAARNALDCAFWDLLGKRSGTSAAVLAELAPLKPVPTAFTISLADPETMAAEAKAATGHPLLKLKLGGDGDRERLAAVRAAVPDARLIADANEAWQASQTESLLAAASDAGVELIEQPLPAANDAILGTIDRPVPVCADESAHDSASLERLGTRYDAVNIKLDKTGGLTEAFATAACARSLGLKIMVGSMVATSLSMAPAILLAQGAEWVDLDGPLLLARDREHGLAYADGLVFPPSPALWG
jgi:L-alanine-DL-glutamate epimerase-like enolase superfamily enzyme